MFGGAYLGLSISSKTAKPQARPWQPVDSQNFVGDELLSIARIGIVTKRSLRQGDIPGVIGLAECGGNYHQLISI